MGHRSALNDSVQATAAASYRSVGKRIEGRLARLVGSAGEDVLLGPWQGDVRTEVLYWIPFLRWVVNRYELDPATITAISRADVSSWYSGIAEQYLGESEPAGRGNSAAVIPPAVLSELFGGYWTGVHPIAHVLRYTHIARLESQGSDATALRYALPNQYLALGGVFDSGVPETPGNVEALRALIGRGRGCLPVIPLSAPGTAPWQLVEDVATDASARQLLERLPSSGLPSALATIAAGASAVVGSVGSDVVTLGVCCGTRTLALYADPGAVSSIELDMLARTARAVGSSFAAVNLALATDVSRPGAEQHG